MPSFDRRSVVLGGGAGAGLISVPLRAAQVSGLRASALRTARQRAPLGIGDVQPMLSWQVDGPAGTLQQAYHIRVASDPALLARPDLWDSGRVASGTSTGVRYGGSGLRSRQRCYWQVRLWNAAGVVSPWSEVAEWEMGLLNERDWGGEWLAVESAEERDDRLNAPRWIETAATAGDRVRFRRSFRCKAGMGSFVLHTSGRLKALTVDGRSLAVPEWHKDAYGSPPPARFDLPLSAGEHVVSVEVTTRKEGERVLADLAALLRVPGGGGDFARLTDGWQVERADGAWQLAEAVKREGHFPWPASPARLLRRSFTLNRVPKAARLYIACLGGYRVWINGTRVGDDELQTEPAEYLRHVPYRAYDVSSLLKAGPNVVGVMVGDGFYASYQAPDGRYAYGPAPRRMRLMIDADEGTRILTNGDWRHRQSPITLSEIYQGEDHDRRLWPAGWDRPGFDDADWTPVWTAPPPAASMAAPLGPPIRATRTLKPAEITRTGPTTHVVDFGQNFGGRVRLTATGRRGQTVSVAHAEILAADGSLDRRNLRVARATDRYILAGDGREALEPVFTFQGFRYAQVDGLADLTKDMVTGIVVSSDLEEIGTFTTDQPVVQKLWLNTLWSQRSNFRGNPTDCPQRDERLGWTGDAQVFWDTAAFNMDVSGFTRSFTRMLRDDQAANGAYPMWSPSPKGLGWGTNTATPGWSDAGVMLPYVDMLHNGDRQVVDENWAAMTAYCNGILEMNPDGLWRNGRGADLGDWLALDAKQPGDETTPKGLIATAMLCRSMAQMAAMAEWTGRDAEARGWRGLTDRSRAAFVREFVTADGRVGNGSHTGFILALRLGLLPDELRAKSGALLAAEVRRRGNLLTTGFLGTPLALDALADAGHHTLACDLLLRTEYPSWGYMVRRGATTTWERWNSDVGDVSMNSFNHYAFGAVCSFLYRRIGGVEPTEPGFRRFRVAPLSDPRFRSGGAKVISASGKIEVLWRIRGGTVALDLNVPPNTVADVDLAGLRRTCGSGSHQLSARLDKSFL